MAGPHGSRRCSAPPHHEGLNGAGLAFGYRAPSASQAASTARSSGVISVMLPGGIALDQAALRPIMRLLRMIASASSRRTPLGAAVIPSNTGSAAWHTLQRDSTTSWTAAKSCLGTLAAALASRGPAVVRKKIAIMPIAATPHTHHGDLRP